MNNIYLKNYIINDIEGSTLGYIKYNKVRLKEGSQKKDYRNF